MQHPIRQTQDHDNREPVLRQARRWCADTHDSETSHVEPLSIVLIGTYI